MLDRPRHEKLIAELRALGCGIQLIPDGDVAGVIAVTDPDTGIDIYLGSGGAPEGVLAAAALRCVGGQFQGRLLFRNDAERARAARWGVEDLNRIYRLEELAKGDVIFAATGVTNGSLLAGVQRRKTMITTESVVMRASTGTVRWVKGEHRPDHEPGALRLRQTSQTTRPGLRSAMLMAGPCLRRVRSILGQPWRWRGGAADASDPGFQPDDLVDQLLLARGVGRDDLAAPPRADAARLHARPVASSATWTRPPSGSPTPSRRGENGRRSSADSLDCRRDSRRPAGARSRAAPSLPAPAADSDTRGAQAPAGCVRGTRRGVQAAR